MSGGDLETGQDLASAVIISLFTDRVAEPSDQLPDGTQNRRGWWADLPMDADTARPIGSRLWLLAREKSTTATLLRARDYATEALQWLVEDGVASRVTVDADFAGDIRDRLVLSIVIYRVGGQPINLKFDWVWRSL